MDTYQSWASGVVFQILSGRRPEKGDLGNIWVARHRLQDQERNRMNRSVGQQQIVRTSAMVRNYINLKIYKTSLLSLTGSLYLLVRKTLNLWQVITRSLIQPAIGNLPFSATDQLIWQHFAKVKPRSIRHRTQKDTGKSKGFAFLEFQNYDRMKTCLKLYHHSTFDDGESPPRKLNVELT